jgi:outer membrane lipoprotein carrier protein
MTASPMTRWMRLMLLGLFLACGAKAHAAGAIEKLKAFAEQTQSARTSFTQTVRDKDGATVQSASGKLSFARPGKVRWEYEKPYLQTIVGDGQKHGVAKTSTK